jgi:hypothetical protein
MRRSLALLAMLMLGHLVGCGAQPGTTTITYVRGKLPPPPITAEETGRYRLYASNSGNTLYTARLRAGEEYGFRQRDDEVVAYARPDNVDREIPLQNRLATSYFWKYQKPEKD